MALPVHISGHNGTGGVVAEVTGRGQLITAPIEYSTSYVASAVADNVAVNLILPKAKRVFVITDVVLTGTKAIDVNTDATVIIFESGDPTSATVDNTLLQVDIARSSSLALTGLNLITEGEAKHINLKSSDTIVNCTLMGYYIGHHHEI